MKSVIFGVALAALATPMVGIAATPAAPAKVVVDLTTGDLPKLKARLLEALPKLKAHYAAQGKALDAVVVVHGEAYRFFLKDLEGTPYASEAGLREAQADLHKRIDALRAEGVRFEVCSVGMGRLGLKPEQLQPGVGVAASAVIALIDWQNAGYAYVPVH